MDDDAVRGWVYAGQADKCCDSSARRSVFDHLADVVDSIEYDIKCGNYRGENVMHQQLVGSLEDLIEQATFLLKELEDA